MKNGYTSIFLRHAFVVGSVDNLTLLQLRAAVDDGFIAWINGVQVRRVNVPEGEVNHDSVAVGPAAADEPTFTVYNLDAAPLSPGSNVLAVQVFNSGIGSSDLFFDCSLRGVLTDLVPPTILSITPEMEAVGELTSVSVEFSEDVMGVTPTSLLINDVPAVSVIERGAIYTFSFPQPAYGEVTIEWSSQQTIFDFAIPPNVFDTSASTASRIYTLTDTTPPIVASQLPTGHNIVTRLDQVRIEFSESVLGVNASDLLINGNPVSSLSASNGRIFTFFFPTAPDGEAVLSWIPNPGIADLASPPNSFEPASWSILVDATAAQPAMVVSEIFAGGPDALPDEQGNFHDWIEIENRGEVAVELLGWSLTDDPDTPAKWEFPNRRLESGQRLLVFASGNDQRPPGGGVLHANFELDADGGFVGLYSAESPRRLISGLGFPAQRYGISYGINSEDESRFYQPPTPLASNADGGAEGIVAAVHFSAERGRYDHPFWLTLSSATPGADIRYTTNGSSPTLTNGIPYRVPFLVSTTMLVRAAGFRSNYVDSTPVTHSYLFHLSPAFASLPVVSIVTDQEHLTGPTGVMGIGGGYHNPSKRGMEWERPTSIEWIDPGGGGFQANGGIRIQGSSSVRPGLTPQSKFSYRLYFRRQYGPGRMTYPLFPLTEVDSFDQLVLRAGSNDKYNPFVRDELARRLSSDMGQIASHGNFGIVFVNGVPYTGTPPSPYYNIVERVHEEFFQSHLGGSDGWDVIKQHFGGGLVDGNRDRFQADLNFVSTQPVDHPTVYQEIGRRFDLVNLVDYLVLNVYCGTGDWPVNNFRIGADRTWFAPSGKWRFVIWDAEWAFGYEGRSRDINSFTERGPGPSDSGLSSTNYSEIALLYQCLRTSPEFRLLWADRVQKHYFNAGALTDEHIIGRFREMEAELADVIPEMDQDILTRWVPFRRSFVFQQMQAQGLLSPLQAPIFNVHGGRVERGFLCSMSLTSEGSTIVYTTDGSDPRVPFTGVTSSGARVFNGSVTLDRSTLIRARAFDGTNWSGLAEADFKVLTVGTGLRISEINYAPPEGKAGEFIELFNVGEHVVDLSGFRINGVGFVFPMDVVIGPGETMVLASDNDPTLFTQLHPDVQVAGYFEGALNNGGERIDLIDSAGSVVHSVDYENGGGWPTSAAGAGHSLEIVDPYGDSDDPANWVASSSAGGTPGLRPVLALPAPVRLNELMALNGGSVNSGTTFPDWIELYNASTELVDLAGWRLSANGSVRNYTFPAGSVINAGSRLVLWCDAATNSTPGIHTDFELNSSGDSLYLWDQGGHRVDAVSFGQQLADLTIGRVDGVWRLGMPSPGGANASVPLALANSLKINEWLANPPPGNPDWLEVFNSNQSLPLALKGLYVSNGERMVEITSLSFLGPNGFGVLLADEGTGPTHLDLRLPAAGATIALLDTTGNVIDSVAYEAQSEGVSQGRFPDGESDFANFAGFATPGSSNWISNYAGPTLNEVLAASARVGEGFVELLNPGPTDWELGGMKLNLQASVAGAFEFPDMLLRAGEYLVVQFDGSDGPSPTPPQLHYGRSLNRESGGVYLFDTADRLVDQIEYGFQVCDQPIGIRGGQWWLLAEPTPGAANTTQAALGESDGLRINEWMPDPIDGDDWIELFNTGLLAVELTGLAVTDNPSIIGRTSFQHPPLSFIAPRGFVVWVASGDPNAGRNHLPFRLDALGETIRLYSGAGDIIDSVTYGWQPNGVSNGRILDGAGSLMSFPASASPGKPNYRLSPHVVISEIMAASSTPLQDAIELHNTGILPVDVSGWYLSDDRSILEMYAIPLGTVIAPGGFVVVSEAEFNRPGNGFELSSVFGGEIWLSEVDATGQLNGFGTGAVFGPTDLGVSVGRPKLGHRIEYVGLILPTLGNSNAPPLIGPLVITELMYHPPDGINFEFVEIQNTGMASLPLGESGSADNEWIVTGGIQFAFPSGAQLEPGNFAIIVGFDPQTSPNEVSNLRAYYNIQASVPIFGPFRGGLANSKDHVYLAKRSHQRPEWGVDARLSGFVQIDGITYDDAPPWPSGLVDGGGNSLQRRWPLTVGFDPTSWVGGVPTPGMTNVTLIPLPVLITPTIQTKMPGQRAHLSSLVNGEGSIRYQWRFNGVNIPDGTNDNLAWDYLRVEDDGSYDLVVTSSEGSVLSEPAVLRVRMLPEFISEPREAEVRLHSNVNFEAVAIGSAPLRYQWLFEGSPVPGATGGSLLLTDVGSSDEGVYSVVVSNSYGSVRANAMLTVLVRPEVIRQPKGLMVAEGQPAALSATVIGTQPISVSWRKVPAGQAVLASVVHSSPNTFLTLAEAQIGDSGSFYIIASNRVGIAISAPGALSVLPDADRDGLPDSWEEGRVGFDSNDPTDGIEDVDGDGLTNSQEYSAGTDYADIASRLDLGIEQRMGQVTVSFRAQPNLTYSILCTDDLTPPSNWTPIVNVPAESTARDERVTVVHDGLTRFYRIVTPVR